MNDTANYTATTQYLNGYHWNHELIENIMFSNELSSSYVANSAAQEVTAIQGITNYFNTTSDHVPVSATFQFSTLANPEFTMANGLKIFPNPVQNELNFEDTGLENDLAISVYDLTGRQILSAKINANTVNVSNLPSGVYILKAGSRFGRFVKR
ncbi:MAG: T9SS type A sorting domain-containing protein [Flavobacterium sp. JAD_PAG50586_2]|nr:MAG: T9SS type A sorting domain-containing protein [Flavobacterium sp. JAD_PAG50586_2]